MAYWFAVRRLLFQLLLFAAPPVVALPNMHERCVADSRAAREAQKNIEALDKLVQASSSDAAALRTALSRLLDDPCIARPESPKKPEQPGALSIRAWWRDGGKRWALGQLQDGDTLTLPPSLRAELTLDVAPTDPVARLLCRNADTECGAETLGWVHRAQRAFISQRADGPHLSTHHRGRDRGGGYSLNVYDALHSDGGTPRVDDGSINESLRDCARAAEGEPVQTRYVGWISCVASLRLSVPALPVGRFHAPIEGWLIIRGRRGHYSFCDEIRAYDLATGAAYVASACSDLVLQPGGSVDHRAARAKAKNRAESGQLMVDNLREATWMLLLMDKVEDDVYLSASSFPVPPALDRRWSQHEPLTTSGGGEIWVNSAQTSLTWTWVLNGLAIKSGSLTWPHSSRAGENHAAQLLELADLSFTPGCPEAPISPSLAVRCGEPGVSWRDADPSDLCNTQNELVRSLEQLRCARGSGPRPSDGLHGGVSQ